MLCTGGSTAAAAEPLTPAQYRAKVSALCTNGIRRLNAPIRSSADTVVRLKRAAGTFKPILKQGSRLTPPLSLRAIHRLMVKSLGRLVSTGDRLTSTLRAGTDLTTIPKPYLAAVTSSLGALSGSFSALRLKQCTSLLKRTAGMLAT